MTHIDTRSAHPSSADITQAEPPQVAAATLALARVLAGPLPLDTRLAVAGALAVLNDVHPPYPPHPEVLEPLNLARGVSEATAALQAFRQESDCVQDVVRAGLAARELAAVTAETLGSGGLL